MNTKYRTLQTYFLWLIDMVSIIVSYMIASFLRYNARWDYGDKTLHYLICVIFLLVGTVYTFTADWNRDFQCVPRMGFRSKKTRNLRRFP